MNNLKFLTLAIAILGFTATSFAQNTATSAATAANASIISPISISSEKTLEFGKMVKPAVETKVMIAADNGNRSVVSGTAGIITLTNDNLGTVRAAEFIVSGEKYYTYAISLPGNGSVTLAGGTTPGTPMKVNDFTSTPSTTGTLSELGTETIKVGATLTVNASQEVGNYTGSFTVTVAYN